MANADAYESVSDTADETVTDTSNAIGARHYQVSVPNFAETTGTSTVERTSFVRLGTSFQDWDDTAASGKSILEAEEASRKLAELVGDATQIGAVESLTTETASSDRGVFGGDASYLLGFNDDTRYRDSDARAAKQTETKKLLTKGGWWDHSDGNRITTTAGDKIEIIQGNYKMVVLGRQTALPAKPGTSVPLKALFAASPNLANQLATWYADHTQDSLPATVTVGTTTYAKADIQAQYTYEKLLVDLAGNAFITDVSGGHFSEQYPSPTPCIKTVEWQPSSDGTSRWTLFQDNGSGNVTTRYGAGDIEDRFEVLSKKTKIGLSTQRTEIRDTIYASKINTSVDVKDDIVATTTARSITSTSGALGAITNTTAAIAAVTNITTAGGAIFGFNIAGGAPVVGGITTINVGALSPIVTINASPHSIMAVDLTRAAMNVHCGKDQQNFTLGEKWDVAFNWLGAALKSTSACLTRRRAAVQDNVVAAQVNVAAPNVQLGGAPPPPV